MTIAKLILFLASTIKASSIFIFGSTGEILTEKSGHLNMGIPGIMFLGALGGLFGERLPRRSKIPEFWSTSNTIKGYFDSRASLLPFFLCVSQNMPPAIVIIFIFRI